MRPKKGNKSIKNRFNKKLLDGASGAMIRGMSSMIYGSSIGRIIGIVTIPLLTRIYSPMDFGVLFVFASLVQILLPFANLRYHMALPLPRNEIFAFSILIICFISAILFSFLTFLILYTSSAQLLPLLSMENLIPYWWLLSLGVLSASVYETLVMWATRQRQYKIIASTQIVQSTLSEGIKIILSLFSVTPLWLLIGHIVGQSGGVSRLLRNVVQEFRKLWSALRPVHLFIMVRRYRGFPFYRLPAQFLLIFSIQAPILVVAFIYDAETAGHLGLATMAISLPFLLIGQAASRAFYGQIRELDSLERKNILHRVIYITAMFGLLIAAPIFLFGEIIFVYIFEEKWRLAGQLAELLALALIFQLPSAATIEINSITRNQTFFLLISSMRFIMVLLGFAVAILLNTDIEKTIIIYTVINILQYIITLGLTILGNKNYDTKV